MKNIKRLLALCLALCMCIAGGESALAMNYAELTAAIGILPYEDAGSDEYVTRGELAYIATKIAGIYVDKNNEDVYFDDVDSTHPYFYEISAMVKNGYMVGYSDGRFEPDYYVSKTDAAVTFVTLLGYGILAGNNGGYPSGYLRMANDLKLFDNTNTGEYVTKYDMSSMVYNTLTSSRIGAALSVKEAYQKTETNFLEDVFDMYEIKGIIAADQFTTIDGEDVAGENGIRINGIKYEGYYGEDYLGYEVDAVVKEYADGEWSVVYVEPSKKNNVVEVSGRDVDDVTGNREVIYNDKENNLKLSDSAAYLLNGVKTNSLALSTFKDPSAYITFIDNNGDKIYDVVKIEKYTTIVVDSINSNQDKIVGKYGDVLDFKNIDYYTITLDGEEITIGDLKAWDVVSYTLSANGEKARLLCSREILSGNIDGTSEDNGTIYSVDGEGYRLTSELSAHITAGRARKMTVGLGGKFYLNAHSEIAAFAQAKDNRGFYYGYLIKVRRVEDNSMILKIFTEEETFEEFTPARTITIDGERLKGTDDFRNLLEVQGGGYRQLIRYNINASGEIKMIDTQRVKTANGEKSDTTMTLDVSVDTSNDVIYNAGMMEGLFYIDDATLLFSVPPAEYIDDISMYSVRLASSYCKTGIGYFFSAYDVDSMYNAAVCLEEASASSAVYAEEYVLVTKIMSVYDEESGEITKKLSGYKDGVEFECMAKNEAAVAGVAKGDIIRCSYDVKDRINHFMMIVDCSANQQTQISTNGSSGQYAYHATERWLYGVVTDVMGDRFKAGILNTSGNVISDSVFFYLVRPTARVITYSRSTGDVTVSPNGMAGDLIEAVYGKNSAARVFVGTYYSGMVCTYLFVD